ncbi:MAG: hypothetical protein ABL932_17490 [Terricaulis sp.]
MPRRKELRGAAFGLLGSFVSRNNDVSGYWALGKLRKHVVKANVSTVCVDLLDLSITPPSDDFAAMAKHFQQTLEAQLRARRIPADWVRSAAVSVEFTPGDAFNCAVVIADDKGREHRATASGTSWVHDPTRELRSTRA